MQAAFPDVSVKTGVRIAGFALLVHSPLNSATYSGAFRPVIPFDSGHLFRCQLAGYL